jgi:hypothetical protein
MASPTRILRAAFLIAALSVLCGCTITSDGAFITGTNVGIGDGHYVTAAPDPDAPAEPDNICCWRSGRWL